MNSISDIISDKSDDIADENTGNTDSKTMDYSTNFLQNQPDAPTTPPHQDSISTPATELDDQTDTDSHGQDNINTNKNENPNIDIIKNKLYRLKDELDSIIRTLDKNTISENTSSNKTDPDEKILESGERIVEGVFDGEKMIGPDGKEYSVPPNYASKSKLVEGDMMKLTITNNGSFIYKQIGPVERDRLVGEIVALENDEYSALCEGKTYKILTASVTFYKGKSGDEVVLLVPKDGSSNWAAVENIISC
ncbi:MAG: hypothetical protein GF349_03020 [Candidatus Magasanikbacteria bacterium]|nr:hypothetical protein [Candidatus Magasanikbacteria bacterium]